MVRWDLPGEVPDGEVVRIWIWMVLERSGSPTHLAVGEPG